MPVLSGRNIEKHYAGQDILQGVSFALDAGDRVGLVGANGSGKTTLLRLIVGQDEPTRGDLDKPRNLRLGYLPQDVPDLLGDKLFETMLEVFRPLLDMEHELGELTHRMAAPDCPPRVLARYDHLHAEFERLGGYQYQARIKAVLGGLGFLPEQFDQPLQQLSGGWRNRALLARLLLEEPEVLLLDEPTNNLDLDAIRWLEQFLAGYKGTLLVVSHDRYLLDKICNRIWELSLQHLETFNGNYSAYLRQRQERFDQRQRAWEARQELIEKEEDFIRRYIAGQRSKEAQGRRTKLERLLRDDPVPKPVHLQGISIGFPPVERSGDIVLRTRGLACGYVPGQPVIRVKDFQLERGERLAIVGPNGSGKTTLMRTLMGQLPPLEGSFHFGASLTRGYLSQTHDVLDPNLTLVDAIRQFQGSPDDAAARDFLAALLFRGDDVFKRVASLSGGQRARLALGRLTLVRPNLLLLDEPTNHLDIPSLETLQEALLDFGGTIIAVSHDRFLVRALARRLLVVRAGEAELLDLTWDEYAGTGTAGTGSSWAASAAEASPEAAEKLERKEQYKADRKRQNELQRKQRRFEELEGLIHELEDEKRMLEHAIGKAGEAQNLPEIQRLHGQYEAAGQQLARYWDEWSDLAEFLES